MAARSHIEREIAAGIRERQRIEREVKASIARFKAALRAGLKPFKIKKGGRGSPARAARTARRAALRAGSKPLIAAAHKGGKAGDAYSLRQEGARLIASNMLGQTPEARRLEWQLEEKRHPRATRVIQHVSLSVPPGQDLDDAGWRRVAEAWLEKIGAKGCSYILVKHPYNSKGPGHGAPHGHLIWSRSRPSGRLVDTRHNYRRWSEAADEVAQELGLGAAARPADAEAVRELEARPRSTPAVQAARRAERRGTVNPWIEPDVVRVAIKSSTTPAQLREELQLRGIEMDLRRDPDGRAVGLRFRKIGADEWNAASGLARDLSLPRVQAQLQANAALQAARQVPPHLRPAPQQPQHPRDHG